MWHLVKTEQDDLINMQQKTAKLAWAVHILNQSIKTVQTWLKHFISEMSWYCFIH